MEKTYYIRKVGGGRPGSEKKNVSVGLFSTFRHPLGGDWSLVKVLTLDSHDGIKYQHSKGGVVVISMRRISGREMPPRRLRAYNKSTHCQYDSDAMKILTLADRSKLSLPRRTTIYIGTLLRPDIDVFKFHINFGLISAGFFNLLCFPFFLFCLMALASSESVNALTVNQSVKFASCKLEPTRWIVTDRV